MLFEDASKHDDGFCMKVVRRTPGHGISLPEQFLLVKRPWRIVWKQVPTVIVEGNLRNRRHTFTLALHQIDATSAILHVCRPLSLTARYAHRRILFHPLARRLPHHIESPILPRFQFNHSASHSIEEIQRERQPIEPPG